MSFADYFSKQSREYARYRPRYPAALFDYLASLAPGHRLAWDCGTGSGQAALELVRHFDQVVATDASAEQLAHAVPHPKIAYRVERAEDVSLAPASVDLVTVAVAVHWFDLDRFYATVRRVLVPNGIIAVWTYNLLLIEPTIDRIVMRYYSDVLAGYWHERVRYIDEQYETLPFPFEEIVTPDFEVNAEWELDQLVGFLDSWSATRTYQEERGEHPVSRIWTELADAWGEPSRRRTARLPLHLRVGRNA